MTKSNHVPEMSGGVATTAAATGKVIVDTGLRNMLSFQVTQVTAVAANEESDLTITRQTLVPGGTQKVLVTSTKGGTGHATAGDSAVQFEWLAIGN
jgi:hypothetical protein